MKKPGHPGFFVSVTCISLQTSRPASHKPHTSAVIAPKGLQKKQIAANTFQECPVRKSSLTLKIGTAEIHGWLC
jgi:hypothetical protein